MALVDRKGRYFDGFGIACQFGRSEDFRCGNRHLGDNDEVPGRPELDLLKMLTNTLGEGAAAENENWHISTQPQCQRLQALR